MNPYRSLHRWVWGVPLAVLLLRCLFQGLLYPWELSGDEAQYWDWSRHPSLSYYTKGPGVTWLISLTTSVLGDSILGIRLGSFICHAIAGVAIGGIALHLSQNHRPTVLSTVFGYQCLLGYQIGGSLMTVDMMMVAGWSVATWAALKILEKAEAGTPIQGAAWLMGAGLGFAFLAKYTALLGAVGLGIALWRQRHTLEGASGLRRGMTGALGFLLLGMLPVLIWNAQRDWPTIEHLLGHLHVPGGDSGTTSWTEYNPDWTLQYLGQIFGLAGPLISWLILRGCLHTRHLDSERRRISSVLLWSALPLLAFYLLVSFKGPTEGNWAVGAYAPLLPLGAFWLHHGCSLLWRKIWILLIGMRGLTTGLLLLMLTSLASPLNSWLESGSIRPLPVHRVMGHQHFAEQLQQLRKTEGLLSAPVICDYYDKTALLAYYLPQRPQVICASVSLGSRPSAYDDFAGTRYSHPRFAGQDVLLVGANMEAWQFALDPEEIRSLGTLIQRQRPREIFSARLKTAVKEEQR